MGRKTSRKESKRDLAQLLARAGEQDLPGTRWVKAILAGERRAPETEPDPDLLEALLEKLAEQQDSEKIAFLAALPAPRAVVKAARRAVHTLRTRKVAVADPRRAGARAKASGSAPAEQHPRSLASIYDAQGYRLVWVAQREPGGMLVHRARISSRLGLVELKSGATSRAEYRQVQHTLLQEATVARIPHQEALWLIHRAGARREARGAALPEGYLRASRALGKQEGPHPALSIEPEAEELLSLYDLAELEVWLPEEELLRGVALRLQEIAASPLLVDGTQRRAQLEHALDLAVSQYFDAARCADCHEFLLDTAHLVAARGRAKEARRLRAAAEIFLEGDVSEQPFAQHFFTRLFSVPEGPSLLTADDAPSAEPKLILP